jgi:hypothetical protein
MVLAASNDPYRNSVEKTCELVHALKQRITLIKVNNGSSLLLLSQLGSAPYCC